MTDTQTQPTFDELGIYPELLAHLTKLKYTTPTPIQLKAIPVGVKGEDMIGIAQTGTGKTLAFSVPMMQRISETKGMGLVLLPTRELALQVEETLHKIGSVFGLRTAVLIGGAAMSPQIKALRGNPHVIVATPGRLIDHMEQKNVSLTKVNILVLDEADRMLDMGFEPQIKRIMTTVPRDRQTMLFSATMPNKIAQIAEMYMKKPLRVEVAEQGTTADRVEQEIFIVKKEDKMRLLEALLIEYKGSILIFSRTKHGAKKIAASIRHMNHSSAEIHSNRSLMQRRLALEGFKSGKFRILVATDIASRGIDVKNIELVINFDLPEQTEDYVHRIGRTGRAGAKGKAISFATPNQRQELRDIERMIRTKLGVVPLPELPEARTFPKEDEYVERERRSGGGRGGRSFGGHSSPRRDSGSSSFYGDAKPRDSRFGRSSGGADSRVRGSRPQGGASNRPGTPYPPQDTRVRRSAPQKSATASQGYSDAPKKAHGYHDKKKATGGHRGTSQR